MSSGGGPLDYRAAGVDIDAANDSKHRIKRLVESTFTAGARGAFGGFGGMFRIPADFQRPVLVSSADGVGTKLRVAIEANRHDTVGHDLVNHCTNDILVQGAVPLFFLDYFAAGILDPDVVAETAISRNRMISAGIRCKPVIDAASWRVPTSITITAATMILSAIGSRNTPSRETAPCARAT